MVRWYRRNARDFPWRRTRNPYRILLSEIMLQQTQASRVEIKYPEFLKRFPTLASLARTNKSTVIRAWRGMGYNNRAVRLQELAQIVMREHGGRLPRTVEVLDALPGIGAYTAHAIACFAFGQHVPAVDTNVRRILSRLYPKESKKLDVWEVARNVLPRRRAYDWNQALFDLGAKVCTQRNPKCGICPVNRYCPSAYKVAHIRTSPVKQEPGRGGIANRIYRGRAVEILRLLKSGKTITAARLGKHIKVNYTNRDKSWLYRLLQTLERDGVVSLKNGSSTLHVSLAK